MTDSDDETPTLSGSALDALKEFYADRDARLKQFEDLKVQAEDEAEGTKVWSMDAFAEDWGESQFWYSDDTATKLANELLKGASKETNIAVVSAPSVFVQLKNLLAKEPAAERPKIWLLEYDRRFEVFPEFIFYDFNKPMDLAPELKDSMDRMIVDPPFLSEDCQTKATTVSWLSRNGEDSAALKLIVCTGERMQNLITRVYRSQGVATTTFEPVHSKGLSNEFFCYANFECELWNWREKNAEGDMASS